MRYVAELYSLIAGARYSIGEVGFDAPNDREARSYAETWAVPHLTPMIDQVVHLQVVRDGVGILSKTVGVTDAHRT
jgi:hypothetical protein